MIKKLLLAATLVLGSLAIAKAYTVQGSISATQNVSATYGLAASTLTIVNINPSGSDVGIGTQSPAYGLDVENSNGYINAKMGICIAGSCAVSISSLTSQWTTSGSNIYNNNAGNVGIGTTGPVSQLDVESTGNTFITMGTNSTALDAAAQYGDGTNYWFTGLLAGSGGGTGNYAIYNPQLSKFPLVILNSNDNVGIGTTNPETELQIGKFTNNGNTQLLLSDYENEGYPQILLNTVGGNYLGIGSDSNEDMVFGFSTSINSVFVSTAMVIQQGGNVGIGTTSPGTLLTVGPNATAVELCRCTAGTLTGMYISCTVGTIATFCTSSVETNISGQ